MKGDVAGFEIEKDTVAFAVCGRVYIYIYISLLIQAMDRDRARRLASKMGCELGDWPMS